MGSTSDRRSLVNAPNPRRPKAPAARPAPAPHGRPPFGIPIGRMVTVTMIVSFVITFAVLWTGRRPDMVSDSGDAGPDHPSAPIAGAGAMPLGVAALPSAASPGIFDRSQPLAVTSAGAAGWSESAQQAAVTARASKGVDPKLFSPALSNLGLRPSSNGDGATADPATLAAAQAAARAAAESIPSPDPALFSRAFSNQGRRPRPADALHNPSAPEIE